MIYLSTLFLLLTFIAITIIILFTTIGGTLKVIIRSILKHRGEPCPFCHNTHSMVTVKTRDEHKKVCKKCGFSIVVDDTPYIDSTNDGGGDVDSSANSFKDDCGEDTKN